YRGRIDDRYVDLGKRRIEPNRRDLREALTAVLAGQPVKEARTKAIGSPIADLADTVAPEAPLALSATIQSLTVEPNPITLHGSNRRQQLLITGRTVAGGLIDVTHSCALSTSESA